MGHSPLPRPVDCYLIRMLSLIGDGVPVVLLCAFHWVDRRRLAVDDCSKSVREVVDGRLEKEAGVGDCLVAYGVEVVGDDDGAAGGHRFGGGDSEAFHARRKAKVSVARMCASTFSRRTEMN